ncbi:helix-turn-helix domain-containing protein [Gloeothece verrucosa]|uniref:Transposase n=1 Tax=Gloeothece verrucosa (strain PCC 7822) TaxID=497965 RepID=E0UMM9_GLOV7|nr:helix-turn-helix domain-containing protein [Gloeothece verrucosa]ADN18209.1 transposase [Gloeothece verrucosa PCC 7822]
MLTDAQIREIYQKTEETSVIKKTFVVLLKKSGVATGQIAEALGCSSQTIRNWVLPFDNGIDAEELPKKLRDGRKGGNHRKVDDLYIKRLKELLSTDPRTLGYSFNRWTQTALAKHLALETGIEVKQQCISRLIKKYYQNSAK